MKYTQHKHYTSKILQEPVDSHDKTDVIGWQSNSRQNQQHGYQPSTRYTGCPDTSQSGSQAENTHIVTHKYTKVYNGVNC